MGTEVSSLTFQTDAEFVAAMTAAYGGSLGILPLLKPGDPALAIFQAVATQDDFLQFLMQIIWAAARLSTSSGSDVDSFVNDFGLTRLPATYATGPVTLTALTAPSFAVPVSPGAIVQTPGGAIQYQIIADHAVRMERGAECVPSSGRAECHHGHRAGDGGRERG